MPTAPTATELSLSEKRFSLRTFSATDSLFLSLSLSLPFSKTNERTNKQTNKQTNQPTNKQNKNSARRPRPQLEGGPRVLDLPLRRRRRPRVVRPLRHRLLGHLERRRVPRRRRELAGPPRRRRAGHEPPLHEVWRGGARPAGGRVLRAGRLGQGVRPHGGRDGRRGDAVAAGVDLARGDSDVVRRKAQPFPLSPRIARPSLSHDRQKKKKLETAGPTSTR